MADRIMQYNAQWIKHVVQNENYAFNYKIFNANFKKSMFT